MAGGGSLVKKYLEKNIQERMCLQPPKLSSSSLHSLSSDKEFPAVTASTTKKYNIEVFILINIFCTL